MARVGEWFEIPSYGKKGLRDDEKKVSPLYKGQYGAGGIPHSMKWKREIGGKGWRFVKKLAKNLVVS